MKKGFIYLSIGLLSILFAQNSLAESVEIPLSIPVLPVNVENQVFITKYPNTAKAIQINLYTTNIAYKVLAQAKYENTTPPLSADKIHQMNLCFVDTYTTQNLSEFYQNVAKNLTQTDLTQIENFYGSKVGKMWLSDNLKLFQRTKTLGLYTAIRGEGSNYTMSNDKDLDKVLKFLNSKAYQNFATSMTSTNLKNGYHRTKDCLEKTKLSP